MFGSTAIQIKHIGSTSIVGLNAKPVIDILLGAPSLQEIESCIGVLEEHGYTYVMKYETELPQRRYFVKAVTMSTPFRLHVHGVTIGFTMWREHLYFRDQLRSDPALREAYRRLKQRLASQFAHDKSAYTDAKSPFISAVLAGLAA